MYIHLRIVFIVHSLDSLVSHHSHKISIKFTLISLHNAFSHSISTSNQFENPKEQVRESKTHSYHSCSLVVTYLIRHTSFNSTSPCQMVRKCLSIVKYVEYFYSFMLFSFSSQVPSVEDCFYQAKNIEIPETKDVIYIRSGYIVFSNLSCFNHFSDPSL